MPLAFVNTATRIRMAVAMFMIVFGVATTTGLGSATPASLPSANYPRTDVDTIRTCTQEIVAHPRFAPRMTVRQWLIEKLGRWDAPDMDLPEGVGTFLSTVITIWCLLTLVAILAHFVWTIWLFARPARTRTGDGLGGGSEAQEITSPDELWLYSQRLAQTGAYRGAVGVLLVALLRRLEAMKVLSFHKSKTNGEYVREFPAQRAGRQEFAQFVMTFERSIYGGLDIRGQTYDAMNSLARRVIDDVSKDT